MPYMEDLSRKSRENVQLAVRESTEVVFVEHIAGLGAVPVFTRPGGRFALSATGVGLVLLAHAPHELQDDVLAQPIERFTSHTVTDPVHLRRVLAEIRSTGIAVSDRQISLDSISVAAPIRDRHGRVIAALSVVADHARSTPRTLIPLIRSTAQAVSHTHETPPVNRVDI
uniref:IclR family transcriptional regulator n=1 Tax=Rhodococcus globerulus TaxID=33008 RepID=UPI002165C817|nr:IclR family transcriptional regulator C-terminal domain-containing protein [Rhodococcus globerulus]